MWVHVLFLPLTAYMLSTSRNLRIPISNGSSDVPHFGTVRIYVMTSIKNISLWVQK